MHAETKAGVDRPVNNLLRMMRDTDYDLLTRHIQFSDAVADDLLYNPGDEVDVVHFPCGPTLVSYLVSNEDGRDVETVLVGREGAIGGIVSQGRLPAYCRILVKYAGPMVRLPLRSLEEAKTESPALRQLFARYADCLMAQMFQSTACNAIHSIEQRVAKWLVAALDRAGDHVLPLTQDQLAGLLGVGRSYASRVLQTFRTDGIIETRRGAMLVKDLDALRARSCLCNDSVKHHFDDVLRGAYPTDS